MVLRRNRIFIVGVGMTKFEKPGRRENFDYPDMAKEAVTKALKDAKITINQVNQATVGYVFGDSTCGQRALYEIGMTGIPIFNVNNNCSTGASALLLAKQILDSGNAECVLAVGFEKMERGSLAPKFMDRTNPLDKHVETIAEVCGIDGSPMAVQMFSRAAEEHMKKYGTTARHMAKIAYKNHKHSVNNPYSQFQEEYSLQQILDSPTVSGPLTKLQCCPTSDGAAAAVLVTEDFVYRHNLQRNAVEILGIEMATDLPSTFADKSCLKVVGYDMTRLAAERLFAKTNKLPTDVDVVELHDCFSANEMITYESLGLCPPGKAGELIDSNNNTYGGKYVINPSGGLISKGHPLGTTGIAQCAELCWQLRGEAGKRQVLGAKLALQQNIGLGGAVVVALYQHGFPHALKNPPLEPNPINSYVDDPNCFKVGPLFKILEAAMLDDKENLIESVRGIFCVKVKNSKNQEGMWIINTKVGKGTVTYCGKDKPDVTISMKDEDVFDLISEKLNPIQAFTQGKVKIQGNMGLLLKLTQLQKKADSKFKELRSKL